MSSVLTICVYEWTLLECGRNYGDITCKQRMACDWVRRQKWRTHERVDVQEEV